MSEIYEGVVFVADLSSGRTAFGSLDSPLALRLVQLSKTAFGVYRVADRGDEFVPRDMEEVAAQLSAYQVAALAVAYDNQCGVRSAALYSAGQWKQVFAEGEELWVPLAEDGEPVLDGPRLKPADLTPGDEYDCVWTAIHAGLDALGVARDISPEKLKDAFCYGKLGWEAERVPGRKSE